MTMIYDPIIDLNILLCAVIAVIGFCGYCSNRSPVLHYLALAFTFFGFSHLLTLFGFRASLIPVIIGLRVTAYAAVIYLMVRVVCKK